MSTNRQLMCNFVAAQSCYHLKFGAPMPIHSYQQGRRKVKKTAILVTFDKEPTGTNDRIFDAIFTALGKLGIKPTVEVKEYDDDHGGPVIYFP